MLVQLLSKFFKKGRPFPDVVIWFTRAIYCVEMHHEGIRFAFLIEMTLFQHLVSHFFCHSSTLAVGPAYFSSKAADC